MKAAIAHGVRPSAMVLGRDSRKKWGKWDFLLAKAYQRYLDELCPQCGMPVYICHIEDSRIEFKVRRDKCFATEQVEIKQRQATAGDKKPEPGVRFAPEPVVLDLGDGKDLELSDFRRPYFRELAVRRGLVSPVDSDS